MTRSTFAALPFRSTTADYQRQADELFAGWQSGAADAIDVFRNKHPRCLDDKILWLSKHQSDEEIRAAGFTLDDARLAVARWYDYADWPRLVEHVEAILQTGSPVSRFETAAEAVIEGDAASLAALLRDDANLIRARSVRVTHFDPPVHGATLLHYLAANGVEGYRQRSPANAVEIARILLEAGAEVDALSHAYGGQCTTMSLLVSSTPPARAGVQVPLVEILVDYGASVEPRGTGEWTSPVATALVFGFRDAAEALVRRGAPIDTLPAAAGLGRIADVRRLLPSASADDRHRALALAAQSGQAAVVGLLLDAGEDPNRFNPPGTHSHSPPLHQAIAADQLEVVKLLVERGARLDIKDTIYHGTPLGWAEYLGKTEIASYLRSAAPFT
jgi:ankyrin repeat protein